MDSRDRIAQRRRKMASMIYSGMKKSTVWERISEEYDVTSETARVDWCNRDNWMPELYSFDNPGKMVLDRVNSHQEVMDRLWNIVRDTENDNAKLGALKELRKVNQDVLEMLQSVGAVNQVAKELHIVKEEEEVDPNQITAVDKLQNKLSALNTPDEDEEEIIEVTNDE